MKNRELMEKKKMMMILEDVVVVGKVRQLLKVALQVEVLRLARCVCH